MQRKYQYFRDKSVIYDKYWGNSPIFLQAILKVETRLVPNAIQQICGAIFQFLKVQ